MAYIRVLTKLPSGSCGWYIYYDINGKMFIDSPRQYFNNFHTLEDVVVIRDILNECIEDMKKREERENND